MWFQDIVRSYTYDEKSLPLLQCLAVSSDVVPPYTLHGGVLHHKGCIWIGNDIELQKKIVSNLHVISVLDIQVFRLLIDEFLSYSSGAG